MYIEKCKKMFGWFNKKNTKPVSLNRAIIVTNSSKLSDILEKRILQQIPEADINTWRNRSISIDLGDAQSFHMDSPSNDFDLFSFWDSSIRDDIKRQFDLPFFYLIEFRNVDFLTKIINLIPSTEDVPIAFTMITDEKAFIRYIKKHVKR